MAADLPAFKTSFIETCVKAGALKFGTFTLKSGRVSPYFFNAGLFHRSELALSIGDAYANALHEGVSEERSFEFDVLFGPAYKGIPLAAMSVCQLASIDRQRYGKISYSFNRKEAKDHGEGGSIVGAPLKGQRIVIIDDVITAGTAIREAIDIIKKEGGQLVGIIVAMDRQEKAPAGPGEDEEASRPSAIGHLRKELGIPILSILTLDDVVKYLKDMGTEDDIKRLEEYRAKYKASD